jgi:putative ABC transport system permease protein
MRFCDGQPQMQQFGEIWRRLVFFFRRGLFHRDLEEEMQHHVAMKAKVRVDGGMSADEARSSAQREFGNSLLLRERSRDMWGWTSIETLLQDIRYGFRQLGRNPGFTIVAVLTLALGIGANTAVFSVVNTILLRPLPFHDQQRLAWFEGNNGEGGLSATTYRVDAYEEFQRHNHSFQEMTAFVPFSSLSETKLMGRGEPTPVSFVPVAGNFFQTLGIQPVAGRLFTPEESVRGGRKAVLLSYPFWQTQFAGDPAIIGQAIQLNNDTVTVVGVLPPSFDFGAVFAPGSQTDLFRPVYMQDIRNWGHMLAVIGRLQPGVTIAQAQAEAKILLPQLKGSDDPNWVTDIKTTIASLKDHVSGKLRRSLIVLWSAVGLIMLIVCVNLSSLLLARAAARSKEFAMRSALGAGRGRLIRQLLTESLVLAMAGAALGLVLAFALTRYLAHQGSIALPLLSSVSVDNTALTWTLLVAVAAALLFGVAPAFKVSGGNMQESLKDSGPSVSQGRKHERLRAVLVVSEIALACVLLIGAGLLLRSFLEVLDVDLGFQPSRAAVIKIDYDDGDNAARRGSILQQILERVRAIPGIESAGITDMLPLIHSRSWSLVAKGKVYSKEEDYDAFVYVVTPGYLRVMGMHLVEGRDFSWSDGPKSEPVIIINQAAARREWPGQDPIGRLALGIGYSETRVVGVISDVRESNIEDASSPQVYVPVTQALPQGAELVVRTQLPPDTLTRSVMSALRELNPGQPATEFRPVQDLVDRAVSPRWFFMLLVTAFAALGLILAALGIYGVVSYSVARQTHEIGIRMALGAERQDVLRLVAQEGLKFTLIGAAVGIAGALALTRFLSGLLYGIQPTDPLTFAGVALLLATVAMLASLVPAWRATKVDPMVALRCE